MIPRVSAFSSKVRLGMTLTVACPWARWRLPDGWTSPSVSARCSALRSSASLNSLSLLLPLALASRKRFLWVGDLLDFTEDVWVTHNGKKVHLRDTMSTLVLGTMTHYAAVDGSEVVLSVIGHHRLTFLVSGHFRRVDKKGCGL